MDNEVNRVHLFPGTLFNTGQLYATAEALAAMQKYGCDPLDFYRDYVTGSNWGMLEADHIKMTHEAIKNGTHIGVAYHLGGWDMLCLSTEPDRSMTTFVMLKPRPEGYDMIEYPAAPLIPGALFNPGTLRATQAALDAFQAHNCDYLGLLRRFLTGDWEDPSERCNANKRLAIQEGRFVQAVYRISDDVAIFVSTKADRSFTAFQVWPKDDEDEENEGSDD